MNCVQEQLITILIDGKAIKTIWRAIMRTRKRKRSSTNGIGFINKRPFREEMRNELTFFEPTN